MYCEYCAFKDKVLGAFVLKKYENLSTHTIVLLSGNRFASATACNSGERIPARSTIIHRVLLFKIDQPNLNFDRDRSSLFAIILFGGILI